MTLFQTSSRFFDVAAVLYAVAFVAYAGALVSVKPLWVRGSTWMAGLAWACHTLALGLRWVDAGVGHPPWTNLYESLVFFSWGVMGAHLYLERRFRFSLSGVLASAVVFAAMGVASLHPAKAIEPLVPALQSWWLLFHVFMACIAYAFFLAASFLAVFFLIKDKVKVEVLSGGAAVLAIIFLSIAAGKTFFVDGKFQLFRVAVSEGQNVIMNFKGADGKLVQEFVVVPGVAPVLWSVLASYVFAAVVLLGGKKRKGQKHDLQKWGRWAFVVATALHAVLLVNVLMAPRLVDGANLQSNPYRLAAIGMTLGVSLLFSVLYRIHRQVEARLPDSDLLDRWGYEAIVLGMPFMTLNLVSGAVWAYYAWGRYWGWDPKETWALITWMVYVGFLHLRLLGGWKGRRTALISLAGFFVVIFTYLGVNLVISGLHSYATG